MDIHKFALETLFPLEGFVSGVVKLNERAFQADGAVPPLVRDFLNDLPDTTHSAAHNAGLTFLGDLGTSPWARACFVEVESPENEYKLIETIHELASIVERGVHDRSLREYGYSARRVLIQLDGLLGQRLAFTMLEEDFGNSFLRRQQINGSVAEVLERWSSDSSKHSIGPVDGASSFHYYGSKGLGMCWAKAVGMGIFDSMGNGKWAPGSASMAMAPSAVMLLHNAVELIDDVRSRLSRIADSSAMTDFYDALDDSIRRHLKECQTRIEILDIKLEANVVRDRLKELGKALGVAPHLEL